MFRIDGIEVAGSPRFEYRTRRALELLDNSKAFATIKPFLAAIREGRRSGLSVLWGKPTFRVGSRTWQAPLTWYASTIVHDGGHAKLYLENRRQWLWFRYTPPSAWSGKEAERTCLRLQLAALRELEADEHVQEYMTALLENPTYHQKGHRNW
jgi:hypothetical protein